MTRKLAVVAAVLGGLAVPATAAEAAKPLSGEYEAVQPGAYVSFTVKAKGRGRRVGDFVGFRRCAPDDESTARIDLPRARVSVRKRGRFSFEPRHRTSGQFPTRRRATLSVSDSASGSYLKSSSGGACPDATLAPTAVRVERKRVESGEWRGRDALGQIVKFQVRRNGRVLEFFDTTPPGFGNPYRGCGLGGPTPTPVLAAPIHSSRLVAATVPFPGGQRRFFFARFTSPYRVAGSFRYTRPASGGGQPCDTGQVSFEASLEGAFPPGAYEPPEGGDGDGDGDPVGYTYRAGQRVNVLRQTTGASVCTSAFALRKGETLYGLTAGHCSEAASGERVVQVLQNGPMTQDVYRRPVGRIVVNTKHGEGFFGTTKLDSATFSLEGAEHVSQTIQRGRRKRLVVKGRQRNRHIDDGDPVCFYGRISGQRCGEVTGRSGFFQGRGEGRLTCTDFDVESGDSGGPVYTRPQRRSRRVRAVGIVVGSPVRSDRMCFARIDDILGKLGMTLPRGETLR